MGCGDSKEKNAAPVQEVTNTIPERKVILIGPAAVGKTAIIHSFVEKKAQSLSNYAATTGVKNQYLTVDVPGGGQNGKPAKIKLDIWDTAGQESYLSINKMFF